MKFFHIYKIKYVILFATESNKIRRFIIKEIIICRLL